MRSVRDFLAQECVNLKTVLEETLRLKYGLVGTGSKEFYEECEARLAFLADEVSKASDADHDGLLNLSILINQLTGLVSRIERSSIGEYSWPFVNELKKIAIALCTEATAASPTTPPQIYVFAGGGLDAYAINAEANRPSGGSKRIHTIIFPRTLKHFVLLHSILGHEVGHAMWRCSQHQNQLKSIFNTHLFNAGAFANFNATASWLYLNTAPDRVKQHLAYLSPRGIAAKNIFPNYANWQAWLEEILCDFVGLLTFGPSFVAAECNLLLAMSPSGADFDTEHPPVGCRLNYLLNAAEILGHTTEQFIDPAMKTKVAAFWDHLAMKRQSNPWFDVFTPKQIKDTTDALALLLTPLKPAMYPKPTEPDLSALMSQLSRFVPPVGVSFDTHRKLALKPIDFRHVLYAGWIVAAEPPPKISFEQINRLCEHGIMQQHAIDLQLSGKSS
jgi:hypothetical protein